MKRLIPALLIALILALFTGCAPDAGVSRAPFEIHFIDVGDGDCILLLSGGQSMLVDTGTADYASKVRGYLAAMGLKKLDYCVATHPHDDHIGNFPNIIRRLEIGKFYMTKTTTTTKVYQSLLEAVKAKGLQVGVLAPGVNFKLGKADVKILSPIKYDYSELNDQSAVLKVTYKNKSFLLTGDIQENSEKDLLKSGQDLKADVLKVAHHGSGTSTTQGFLKAVSPSVAVISCAKNSKYGFPDGGVVNRLADSGAKTYTTAKNGDIVMRSDGFELDVICQRE